MVNPPRKSERGLSSAADKKISPSSSAKEKLSYVNAKKTARTFLFSGEEEFLKAEAIDKLMDGCRTSSGKIEPAYHVFWAGGEGEEFDIEKIIAIARTANLFSSNQIVVVKYVEKLKSVESERLISYINNPTDRTYLVLTSGINLRRIISKGSEEEKVLQLIVDSCPNLQVVNFRYLKESELGPRIKAWVKERGKIIAEQEVSLLVANAGKSLLQLNKILDQACLYAKDKPRLEATDLAPFIGGESKLDVYKMLDAVLDRNIPYALEILKKMTQVNIKADLVIGTFARELTDMYKAKKFIKRGLSAAEIQTRLRKTFYFDKFINYVRKIEMRELENKLKRLLYIDNCIKTGRLKPYFALESWIIGKLPL